MSDDHLLKWFMILCYTAVAVAKQLFTIVMVT